MKKTTIGESCSLHARIGWQGLTKKEYLDTGDYYLITGTDFNNGHIDFNNCHYVAKERYDQDQHIQVGLDDVLVTKDGTIGKVAIIDTPINKPATLNSGVFVVRPKDKTALLPRYLMIVLLSNSFNRFIERIKVGCTIAHLNQEKFINYEFPLPLIEDQEKIVSIFNSLLSICDKRKRELAVLDDLIKARFVEMFGSIHENRFPKCKLREVAHIKHGFAFSGEFFSDEDNGVVLVTPGNFALGGGFQEIRNRYFTSDYPDEYVLHAGDLIVTMTDLSKKVDTLGYGAIVPETDKVYLHNQRIGLFDRLDQRLNPVFMRWFMQTNEYRLEIVRTSTGSTVHHTSPDRILDSVVFLPPIEIQNSFVSFAKQVDKSKAVAQKALDEAQLLFDSLMQKYFG